MIMIRSEHTMAAFAYAAGAGILLGHGAASSGDRDYTRYRRTPTALAVAGGQASTTTIFFGLLAVRRRNERGGEHPWRTATGRRSAI